MENENIQMSDSCKKLILTHEMVIKWLLENNHNGIHDNSIRYRKNEIKRLNSNPF